MKIKPFKTMTSKTISIPWKDIDTDMIIPAQYLTSVSDEGYGNALFKRFRESDPDFILNHVNGNDHQILIADENFGCGSSREHAVWALYDFGIRAILAPSFSDIFINNSYKNGLLPIELPHNELQNLRHLIERDPEQDLTIDLQSQKIIVDKADDFHFEINSFRKNCLLNGLDDLGYLLDHKTQISNFRKNLNSFVSV